MTTSRPDLHALRRPVAAALAVPRPRLRWRTRVLLPLAVIAATVAVLAYAARDVLRPAMAVRVTPVVPAAATVNGDRGDGSSAPSTVEAIVQAPGWIEPAPYAIGVPALAEGVVAEILVLEGDRVQRDQVVARLLDTDARIQLRTAEANVAERRADIDRAAAALAATQADVAVDLAAADTLRDEVDRKRELVAAGGVSPGEFRRMELRLAGLDAQVVAAQRRVDEARATLGQADAALVAAESARDEAALRLERMAIRSPVAGVVLSRLVEPGARITMGGRATDGAGAMASQPGVVLRVYDPTKLQVRVDVPLPDAAKVGIGTPAEIVTEALPDRTFTGRVTRIVQEANIARNAVQFKVAIDDPVETLKPDMLTRVRLRGSVAAGAGRVGAATSSDGIALLAPIAALVERRDDHAACWVAEASGASAVARRRDLVVAPSAHEGHVTVVSGLRPGDRLIVDPPPQLRDGSRIRVLGEVEVARAGEGAPNP